MTAQCARDGRAHAEKEAHLPGLAEQRRNHLAARVLHPQRELSVALDQLDGTSSPGSLELAPKRVSVLEPCDGRRP